MTYRIDLAIARALMFVVPKMKIDKYMIWPPDVLQEASVEDVFSMLSSVSDKESSSGN